MNKKKNSNKYGFISRKAAKKLFRTKKGQREITENLEAARKFNESIIKSSRVSSEELNKMFTI